ncbi:DUF202 domain-containing protein [Microbacterium sp. A84]|uniref:DUF202 domain-containing protein n=1 Tax=Microbacterium sp. A84 TaxID=3450715 RepID=UPI003F41ED36
MALYDPGLQPERTELAWRRTALAIAVGSLVSMRVLPVMLGSALWMLLGVAGMIIAALMWLAARARYRSGYRALHDNEGKVALPDGSLIAVTALFSIGVGLVALAAVIVTVAP